MEMIFHEALDSLKKDLVFFVESLKEFMVLFDELKQNVQKLEFEISKIRNELVPLREELSAKKGELKSVNAELVLLKKLFEV